MISLLKHWHWLLNCIMWMQKPPMEGGLSSVPSSALLFIIRWKDCLLLGSRSQTHVYGLSQMSHCCKSAACACRGHTEDHIRAGLYALEPKQPDLTRFIRLTHKRTFKTHLEFRDKTASELVYPPPVGIALYLFFHIIINTLCLLLDSLRVWWIKHDTSTPYK